MKEDVVIVAIDRGLAHQLLRLLDTCAEIGEVSIDYSSGCLSNTRWWNAREAQRAAEGKFGVQDWHRHDGIDCLGTPSLAESLRVALAVTHR